MSTYFPGGGVSESMSKTSLTGATLRISSLGNLTRMSRSVSGSSPRPKVRCSVTYCTDSLLESTSDSTNKRYVLETRSDWAESNSTSLSRTYETRTVGSDETTAFSHRGVSRRSTVAKPMRADAVRFGVNVIAIDTNSGGSQDRYGATIGGPFSVIGITTSRWTALARTRVTCCRLMPRTAGVMSIGSSTVLPAGMTDV